MLRSALLILYAPLLAWLVAGQSGGHSGTGNNQGGSTEDSPYLDWEWLQNWESYLEGYVPSVLASSSPDTEAVATLLSSTDILSLGLTSWLDPTLPDPCGQASCCDPSWQWAGLSGTSGVPCAWQGVCCANWRVVAVDIGCQAGRCRAPISSIPWSRVGRLSELRALNISGHAIGGRLPSLGSIDSPQLPPKLQFLDASRNMFDGPLPSSWYKLSALKYLNLASNSLSGGLPSVWSLLLNLMELRLEENSLQGNIPPTWLAMGAEQDGSLVVLDVSDNCGMCGSDVPIPGGTIIKASGTSLGSDCSVFNCGKNLLPHIMIGLGAGCLLMAVCILGRFAFRRCGPQGLVVGNGPMTRVHADPQWVSVFGGDPRGPQRPTWLPPPLLVAEIDVKADAPTLSHIDIVHVTTEAQLQAIKEARMRALGSGGNDADAMSAQGDLIPAGREGSGLGSLQATPARPQAPAAAAASSPIGGGELELGLRTPGPAGSDAGPSWAGSPAQPAASASQYDPALGMEQFAHLFAKPLEMPFDALVIQPDLSEVGLGLLPERFAQAEAQAGEAGARSVGGRIMERLGLGSRRQAVVPEPLAPLGTFTPSPSQQPAGPGPWNRPQSGRRPADVTQQATPSPSPAVLLGAGGGSRRGTGGGATPTRSAAGTGSQRTSEAGRALAAAGAALPAYPGIPSDVTQPDLAPSAPPQPLTAPTAPLHQPAGVVVSGPDSPASALASQGVTCDHPQSAARSGGQCSCAADR
uniref:Leucine-rich repeat-containing N-terminal plant-type domain-containing protein n=1 Tax=Chlamydomonas leiostraca TaxID=1034604 RepID=A0A7S0RSS5_9CHLO|mmetsp:Transcript_3046/g.7607  ORF Transcript_3046/g.7607 Transcript_3046/m.7607 type:complete len:750 (+) Transcript_3046:29-2278(+)